MIIDFHTHGHLTKKADYDPEFQRDMIRAAKETGLTALVLSEHFNTTNYYSMYEQMQEAFTYEKDHYLIEGIRLYMGLEVDVAEGGHVIVIQDRETIYQIRQVLDAHEEDDRFITFDDLATLATHHHAILIGAHPFRGPEHVGTTLTDAQLRCLDALDMNATDLYTRGQAPVIEELETLAHRIDRPIVTGSDSHYPIQVGSNRTRFIETPTDIAHLRRLIHARQFTTEISDLLNVKVFAARTTKAYLKAELKKRVR